MKILFVNWAPLWLGSQVGGGVNVYSQNMAVEMVKKGHDVYSISAGYAYSLMQSIFIKRGPDFYGVANFEIFNSPNLAPGFFNYENPESDVSEPDVEAVFKKFLLTIKPHVVHFQNIEGFSAKCITIAKDLGIRVVYSLHNYHPVCNEIYLLHKDLEICKDFNKGVQCLDCIYPPPREKEFWKRKVAYFIHRLPYGYIIWDIWDKLRKIPILKAFVLNFINSVSLSHRADTKPEAPIIENTNHLPIEKEPLNQESSDDKGASYLLRRKNNIEAINQSHLILAVSSFVKDLYVNEMGMDPQKVMVSHIGNPMADILERENYTHKEKKEQDEINFIFLGLSSLPKGLPFLLNTLGTMSDDLLSKIRLSIFARDAWMLSDSLNALLKKLAALTVHHGYRYEDLPGILSGMDIGVVPPIWYDNAPQVVFEMMAMKVPVLGASIGGIPDFVRHNENGLLFNPGDTHDLKKQITKVVNNPLLINGFRKKIQAMKTISEHAEELEKFYYGTN